MEDKIIKKLIKEHMGKIGEKLCQKEGVGGKLYPQPLPTPALALPGVTHTKRKHQRMSRHYCRLGHSQSNLLHTRYGTLGQLKRTAEAKAC